MASEVKKCHVCQFQGQSVSQQLQHLRIHESDFNFRFVCPLPTCHFRYETFEGLNSHISFHNVSRERVVGANENLQCSNCERVLSCNQALCYHYLNDHLKNNESVMCPLASKCGTKRTFPQRKVLASHLSQYHPGWKEDYGVAEAATSTSIPIERSCPQHAGIQEQHMETEEQEYVDDDEENWMDVDEAGDQQQSDSSCTTIDDDYEGCYTSDEIVSLMAKFYAWMEGKLIIPLKSVQKISKRLSFISGVLHQRISSQLRHHLKKENLSDETVERVISSVLRDDPFYNVHHKNAPGVSLTSDHYRKSYYKRHFKYVGPTQRSLRKSPKDKSALLQYIPVGETLKVLLEDPSIQAAVDKSFSDLDNRDPNIIRNYTDGTVFQNRNVPKERIDLFIFQDAFRCAKRKSSRYKTLGVYMVIGNLKPHQRSKLKAKRLVMLIMEKAMTSTVDGVEKTFRKLVDDLKKLERTGIEYKGRLIAFRFQFLIGDNLGQHTLGGFLESFSTVHYFCRFCLYKRDQYRADQNQDPPAFRVAPLRTPDSYRAALQKRFQTKEKTYQGIKLDSIFNELRHFHVCDPGQPPCLGHDLFIGGVVDCDLAAMIKLMVEKGWFSYDLLNRRIREFTCEGSDVPNKPPPTVPESGETLGGYAVHNWTLLRLLPFIIGDKVKVSDDVWKLYLLLKRICERVCAPALTLAQIDLLEDLIKQYMKDRKFLPNPFKPKHHYFAHMAELYRLFGPLIALWTMGFEQCHQYFVKVAATSRNFINLPKLLASKHQVLQAYQSTGELFPSEVIHHSMEFPLVPESYENQLQDFLKTEGYSASATVLTSITAEEIMYKGDQWLFLEPGVDENCIYVGKILLITHDNNEYKAIVEKHKTKFWKRYGLYKIKSRCTFSAVNLLGVLENPCPHPTYAFQDKLCLSLKHVLPQ